MGLPGAGKSSAAKQFPNFTVINQDKIGNRNDCINAMKRALSQRKNVLIDRTNINRSQRRYFLDVAKDFNTKVYCCFFDVSPVECIERIKRREKHETLPSSVGEAKIIDVISKFNKSLELPTYEEGFEEIYIINDNDTSEFLSLLTKTNSENLTNIQ